MSKPTKILICTDVTARGGVDLYVGQLVAAHRGHGAEVMVALDQALDEEVSERLGALGAVVHLAELSGGAREDGRATAEYRSLVDAVEPDVVHLVRGSHRSGFPLTTVLSTHPARLVVTEQYIPDDTWLGAEHRSLIGALYDRASAVIFVSDANRSTMAASLKDGTTPWTVIPNAVDVDLIGGRAIGLDERRERLARLPVRLVAASRLSTQKGLDVLMDAFARVPAETMTAAIFGEGPEEMDLRSRAERLPSGQVTFRPWCADVVGALAEADLFVLPSRNEGMSFTLLEAMAAGVPIVAADAPGVAEALGCGGLIVPRGDHVALAEALLDAVADPLATMSRTVIAAERVRRSNNVRDAMRTTLAVTIGRAPAGVFIDRLG